MSDVAISTSNLCRRFGRVTAVQEVSLSVPRGSVYGYLGRNGAGKTTTIQMLMGLLLPDSGTVSVLDFDPVKQEVAMKRVVSYVPERVQMPEWMTVKGLINFGAGVHPNWDRDLAEQLRVLPSAFPSLALSLAICVVASALPAAWMAHVRVPLLETGKRLWMCLTVLLALTVLSVSGVAVAAVMRWSS